MTEKEMVSAKIAGRTKERLDEIADREGISRSQVIDRMLKQGLDVEEGDVKVVPIESAGQSETYAAHQNNTLLGLVVITLIATVISLALQFGVI